MLRDRSSTEALFTYATFFALSLAIHMLAILGGRQQEVSAIDRPRAQASGSASEREAPAGRRR